MIEILMPVGTFLRSGLTVWEQESPHFREGRKSINDVLLGIDEFHHVSAGDNNRLGAIIDEIMSQSNANIVAMTGSYFRGDAVPILLEKDEEKFDKVTYTYYEQLNGYNYLKSLSLNYCFYTDSFFGSV